MYGNYNANNSLMRGQAAPGQFPMQGPSTVQPTGAAGMGPAIGAGLGGLAGTVLGGLTHRDPTEAAQGYLGQVAPTITPYYQPYVGAGEEAIPTLQQQYGQLLADPTSIMRGIGGQYQESPGYQWQVDQATKAANQAAAAGGMLGTPAEQQQLAQTVTGLANQDYYNYVDRALRSYEQGLGGYGGLAQLGYGASSELAQNLANILQSQAQLEYAGQTGENIFRGGMAGGVGGLAGGLAGLFF